MKHGLYSIHVQLQDARSRQSSGVIHVPGWQIPRLRTPIVFDPIFSALFGRKDGTFKGEVLVQRHTSSPDANPRCRRPSPVRHRVTGSYTDTRSRHEWNGPGRRAADLLGDYANWRGRFSQAGMLFRACFQRRHPGKNESGSACLPGPVSRSSRPAKGAGLVTML